jgi:uncharacterized SAM-binding protein YcdF (DUF218 family)
LSESSGQDSGGKDKGISRKFGSGVTGVGSFFVRLVRNIFALFTFIMIVVMFTPIANFMARPLTVPMELREVDLVAVLGGGAYRNGILSGSSNERLLHGLRLYKSGLAGKIIFAGGSVLEPSEKLSETIEGSKKDAPAPDVVEALIMRDVALSLGMDKGDLSVDADSLNTYENVRAIKEHMKGKRMKSCLLVTSPTHMYRAIKVSKRLHMDCSPAPVGDYTSHIDSPIGRLSLMRAVIWEYTAIVLYKSFGYI